MLIFINSNLNTVQNQPIEVDGSTTIDELYRMVWDMLNIHSDPIASSRTLNDGFALIFAGKRLRTRFYKEMAIENGISEEILRNFGIVPKTLADYNIQKDSRIYCCYIETNARKQFHDVGKEECSVCFESFSNMGSVGYRKCLNNHYFHFKCIRNPICPLCRTQQWVV